MHALAVMHRWTLYENVGSAKIKVPSYTTNIDILHVASMHRIVIHCIYRSISMNHYTPNIYIYIYLHTQCWEGNFENVIGYRLQVTLLKM